MSDVWALSIAELGGCYRQGDLSPVEVVQAHLDRINRWNAQLLAYVHVDGDRALSAARTAEVELRNGGDRGPLHGIPVAYKDVIDVQDLPTTAGSRLLGEYVARVDAAVVAKLRQAGAICLGKLNTTELASGDMALHGDARNPWDLAYTTGGSSSGPAGAVAAGLATVAVGTDTGGSVRVPSSFCGVVGMRPTFGRVSQQGIVPLSWSHDQAGPLGRTVRDVAWFLEAMSGPVVGDESATSRAVQAFGRLLEESVPDLHGVRLGVPRSSLFDNVTPEVRATVADALRTLTERGAVLVDVTLPYVELATAAQWALAYCESYTLHHQAFAERRNNYGARFLSKIAGAAFLTAEELVTAAQVRRHVRASFRDALSRVDVIVTPTTAAVANRIGETYPGGDAASLTRPVSLVGLPALSVPCGRTAAGLPVGMHVIGRAWDEAGLLRVGHAVEQTLGFRVAPAFRTSCAPTGGVETTDAIETAHAKGAIDSAWVLDAAGLAALSFVDEDNAAAIASSIGPVKVTLARAREALSEAGEGAWSHPAFQQ